LVQVIKLKRKCVNGKEMRKERRKEKKEKREEEKQRRERRERKEREKREERKERREERREKKIHKRSVIFLAHHFHVNNERELQKISFQEPRIVNQWRNDS
jgi:hypothetical protein